MDDNELLDAFRQELPVIIRMINGYISSNPVLAQQNMKLANLQLVTKSEQTFFESMDANTEETNEAVMLAIHDDPDCKVCVDNATGLVKICVAGNACPPGFH